MEIQQFIKKCRWIKSEIYLKKNKQSKRYQIQKYGDLLLKKRNRTHLVYILLDQNSENKIDCSFYALQSRGKVV